MPLALHWCRLDTQDVGTPSDSYMCRLHRTGAHWIPRMGGMYPRQAKVKMGNIGMNWHPALPVYLSYTQVPTSHPDKWIPVALACLGERPTGSAPQASTQSIPCTQPCYFLPQTSLIPISATHNKWIHAATYGMPRLSMEHCSSKGSRKWPQATARGEIGQPQSTRSESPEMQEIACLICYHTKNHALAMALASV